jgi:hypothetical protein
MSADQLRSTAAQAGLPVLVNIAQGKPASQSSLSQWSAGPDEATRAVAGPFPAAFAFHTETENCPWWQVDLLDIYPIERIVVHNRLDGGIERAKTLKVEVSVDNEHWILVHSGVCYFSGGEKGEPLVLPLGSAMLGRFVRLSLSELQPLVLAQIQVFVRIELLLLSDFLLHNGVSQASREALFKSYSVVNAGPAIVGLHIRNALQFGNLLMQYTNAILLAEKTGLKYIKLPRHALSDPIARISVGKLTFLPSDSALPTDGAFLIGSFFGASDFVPVLRPLLDPDEVEYCRVAREIIRPHLLTGLPPTKDNHFEDELTIHIRSGDIFGATNPINPAYDGWHGYRQPPLAFYTLAVDRLLASGTITKVRLIFQDRGNPCIDALEEFLAHKGIPFRSQSGTLAEDISALIDAPHLAFGLTTFGYAACRLTTRRIKTLHFFAPELCGHYALIPGIERVFEVRDREGGYLKAFEPVWYNTPEQRELMCAYPSEALEVRELKRRND